MNFQPNDKVICINGVMPEEDASCFSDHIVTGGIYAVRGVTPPDQPGEPQGLLLVGIVGELHYTGEEFSFRADRFRKLGEAATVSAQAANNVETS